MQVSSRILIYLRRLSCPRKYSTQINPKADAESKFPEPEFDLEYLCNPDNKHEIETNIKERKGVGNIDRVNELYVHLKAAISLGKQDSIDACFQNFKSEAIQIPNRSCSLLKAYGETPHTSSLVGVPRVFSFEPKEFSSIARDLRLLRTENLANFSGHRSYSLMGQLAELEQALVQYSISHLLRKNFQLISVPDILHGDLVESCGMNTKGDRTQVYKLDPHYGSDLCLSGTAEMALAGYLMNQVYDADTLPVRLAAVSRCYRAETSSLAEERGIYRVHQFTKVEMFGACLPHLSDSLLLEFRDIQEVLFSSLGLHFRVLDMPIHELGAPAFRKFDIEAWLPGRAMYGEVSSCSDCTDYQARRLNVKYVSDEPLLHVHTVNGTACAVPRMLIALLETHQQEDGSVRIPEPLRRYMNGDEVIARQSRVPEMKSIRGKVREVHK